MSVGWIIGIIAILFAIVVFIIAALYIKIWIQALFSGARVGFFQLIGMGLRKVSPQLIVSARISAVQAGIDLPTQPLESVFLVRRNPQDVFICVNALIIAYKANLDITFADLQAHHFAGGRVDNLVKAMIAANRAKINLSFDVARAIDLAGRDILDAVHTTVMPKVIDCPIQVGGHTNMLDAVAKDGIRLLVRARVTVRSNISQLVRGATEETIIARVGQGIVSAIGSANTYKDVLENPDRISKKVLDSGLDAQTAFEIVSIDIADVSVASVADLSNVGARLETERAEADKQMRQAEAEGRRAMAVAREQEMRALVQENRAKVVLAESEVPKAMAEAFRSGNMGIMDYYRMKNVVADTQMRDAIGKRDEDKKQSQ
ncbi:MAG: flotillin-like protein FloA [Sedimentisphaerales bacterium]|nr:flotillin-like protein FloA [Sedimentisphaerales bacterium]